MGRAWRLQGSLIRTVIENNPAGKRPLGIPRLRWEDCVIEDVGRKEADLQWREAAEERNRWSNIYLGGTILKAVTRYIKKNNVRDLK